MPYKLRSNNRKPGEIAYTPFFRGTHLVFDLAALTAAWEVTLETRLMLNPYFPSAIPRQMMPLLALRLEVLLPLWALVSVWLNIYEDRGDRSLVAALFRVAESTVVITMLAVVVAFFSRELGVDLSRSFVLLFAPICLVCLTGSLALAIQTARSIENRWMKPTRLAFLGSPEKVHKVAAAMAGSSANDVVFRGCILPETAFEKEACSSGEGFLPVLGTTTELAALINREFLDRIVVTPDYVTEPKFEYYVEIMKRMGVTVSHPLLPATPGVSVSHRVSYGMHLIDLAPAESGTWQDSVKRAMDAIVSLVLIALLLPVFAALACCIRVTSRGPVFYRSQRVGKGGRYFTFWKFRSMYVNASRADVMPHNEGSGHLFKIRRDPRITPVGRIMRRLSLDELPQLFNVLAGDMSLVGPRPLPAEDLGSDGMSPDFSEWARQRSMVRPGITGLWQVGGRSDVSFAEMMELDLRYVRDWSLILDIRILLKTPRAVIVGTGAY